MSTKKEKKVELEDHNRLAEAVEDIFAIPNDDSEEEDEEDEDDDEEDEGP
jgi:hypothetical protein